MANLVLNGLYGSNLLEYTNLLQGISLQFHLTAKCDQRCKHCYMFDSEFYEKQIKQPLTKEEVFRLIDEYCTFINDYHCKGEIALSGGDPILSPYFWDVLEYIHIKYSTFCVVGVLGNPYHIDVINAKRMKKYGVKYYQVSIDGLQKTHDYLRKPGSFNDSLRALQALHNERISTIVSFTISKLNYKDLIPLYNFLDSLDYVDIFGFNRLVPTGNGKHMKNSMFTPEEYRKFLFDVYSEMVSKRRRLYISMEDKMWRPFLYDMGLTDPLPDVQNKKCISGCMCGTATTSVLADGTMFPCRRMEKSAGKFPEKSFRELFIHNEVTKQFRQYEKYDGCCNCELFKFCRGCPAIKYATTGDFYHEDPNCWRAVRNEQ